MREFGILFKHELKMLFPILSFGKKKKHDWFGSLLSIVLTVFVLGVFIALVSKIANGYVAVKLNKISNPNARAVELLNILYTFVMVLMMVGCIRKMRHTLTDKRNKEIYLRLPVKENQLLLSKLLALLVWTIVASVLCLLPVNIIFFIAIKPSFVFWIKTTFVMLTMPVIVFGISTLLLLPVIKLSDMLKDKYWILFVLTSGLLVWAFVIYSKFLKIVKLWLETGSIKFLFNNSFITALQTWLKWSYPTNCFANIMMGTKLLMSTIVVLMSVVASLVITLLVARKLFYLTLYKTESNKSNKVKNKYTTNRPIIALIKKEFICIYRNPKYLFSYFAIAIAMPVMAYCCYTLFESLILNALGLKITFSLAILVLLIFSILTNTFCATNVSREGVSFLKMKSLAIKPSHLLLAKVLLCGAVSTLSVLASVIVLVWATNLAVWEGLLCGLIVGLFSLAQILVATRLDLNSAKLSSTLAETEATTSKTIVKVIGIGLVLALLAGIMSIVIFVFSQGSIMLRDLNLKQVYAYILPLIIVIMYFIGAVVYYNYKIDRSFENLGR